MVILIGEGKIATGGTEKIHRASTALYCTALCRVVRCTPALSIHSNDGHPENGSSVLHGRDIHFKSKYETQMAHPSDSPRIQLPVCKSWQEPATLSKDLV